jgi:hypothetical protein
MVGDAPPHDYPDFDDEHDDLVALDFSVPDDGDEYGLDTGLDALGGYGPDDEESDLDAFGTYVVEEGDDELPVPVFTVTNPPGTVTVTAFLDGRVRHIDLSPKVADMTEADLAEEIVLIAGLATQDAKSAQYAFMLEGMREQGHDSAATRDFLTRDLDLPSPEQAQTARAHIFATRYSGDHD